MLSVIRLQLEMHVNIIDNYDDDDDSYNEHIDDMMMIMMIIRILNSISIIMCLTGSNGRMIIMVLIIS